MGGGAMAPARRERTASTRAGPLCGSAARASMESGRSMRSTISPVCLLMTRRSTIKGAAGRQSLAKRTDPAKSPVKIRVNRLCPASNHWDRAWAIFSFCSFDMGRMIHCVAEGSGKARNKKRHRIFHKRIEFF